MCGLLDVVIDRATDAARERGLWLLWGGELGCDAMGDPVYWVCIWELVMYSTGIRTQYRGW